MNYDNLEGKNIEFNELLDTFDIYETIPFDEGMRANVTSAIEFKDTVEIELNFSRFVEYNKTLAKNNWPGDLTWDQTEFWPKDYRSVLTIVSKLPPFKIFYK